MKDFFISYNSNDKKWAEWLAWTLEAAGYSTVIQAWDFRPGGNFVLEMQKAATNTRKTLAVLSQHYLDAAYTHPEWADALRRDPQGNERTLIPVRVGVCQPTGLLASVIYVDLVGRSVEEAQQMLLDALNDRAKPAQAPAFPGGGTPTDTTPRAVPPAPTASAGAGRSQGGGGRGVSIGGNVSGSVIVTGDNNQVHQQTSAASFPGTPASSVAEPAALAIWREKLDFLLAQEPLVTDPAQKFALKKQIEEAQAKIRALGG